MYRDDRGGCRGDGCLHGVRRHQQCVGVDVDEDRRGADRHDGFDGRDERVRRHDDLVTGADAECREHELECVSPTSNPYALRRAAVLGELRLEPIHVVAADKRVGARNGAPGFVELGSQLIVCPAEVEQRNGGGITSHHASASA